MLGIINTAANGGSIYDGFWITKFLTEKYNIPSSQIVIMFNAIQFMILLVITYFLYQRMVKKENLKITSTDDILNSTNTTTTYSNFYGTTTTSTASSTSATTTKSIISPSTAKSKIPKAGDVWAERRNKGIVNSSSHVKKDHAGTEKPFGSSYYYAHNNTSTTGGYKDGLRMEDFTMNGPRLLSVGNRPVVEQQQQQQQEETKVEQDDNTATTTTTTGNGNENENSPDTTTKEQKQKQLDEQSSSTTKKEATTTTMASSSYKLISRYLWDDPGNSDGIATIRVDTLPNDVAWKDINDKVVKVQTKLPGEGLLVDIITNESNNNNENNNYRLEIKQLYGKAQQVKAIRKSKRLLIKIYKEKKIWDKSYINEWPHPYKTKV